MTPSPRAFGALVALALGLAVVVARRGDGAGRVLWSESEAVASSSWGFDVGDATSRGGDGDGGVGDFCFVCFLPPMVPSPFDFFAGGFCGEADLRLTGTCP
jgi:hypothetical protein